MHLAFVAALTPIVHASALIVHQEKKDSTSTLAFFFSLINVDN